jgi:hypothetical protein
LTLSLVCPIRKPITDTWAIFNDPFAFLINASAKVRYHKPIIFVECFGFFFVFFTPCRLIAGIASFCLCVFAPVIFGFGVNPSPAALISNGHRFTMPPRRRTVWMDSQPAHCPLPIAADDAMRNDK